MDPEQREEEIKKMKNAEWLKSDEEFFGKNPIRGGLCGAQYDDRVVNLMWDDPPVGSVTWKAKQRLKDPGWRLRWNQERIAKEEGFASREEWLVAEEAKKKAKAEEEERERQLAEANAPAPQEAE